MKWGGYGRALAAGSFWGAYARTASSIAIAPPSVGPRSVAITGLPKGEPLRIRWQAKEQKAFNVLAHSGLSETVTLSNLKPSTAYISHILFDNGKVGPLMEWSTTACEGNADGELSEFSRLEIRCGKILDVAVHPEADGLYVERVDFGEAEPRTIVSGLAKFQSVEAMSGRMVVGLLNLPPRSMRGVESSGMLLCASTEERTIVEPISPPADATLGDLCVFDGTASAPLPSSSRAGRAWTNVAPTMATDQSGNVIAGKERMVLRCGPNKAACSSTVAGGNVK
jgi:tRNA-binding EMAP/Myf-like protein